ncbi:sigma-70 family RNA polymerase sigma factor [Roseiconus lacunae]|uniref:sigma-70 family RNA polymerase sigma factor n=1 Tax=Roseiconus lacunae TaxID=2605694 RepID=UPI0011F0AB6E|nr:sigma-70 family RNA polymerase sigma factor [Roseiconus lacunae]
MQRASDTDDLAELVTNQHQQLRSFVRTLGVDADWVDDVAQEVFLVAWRERKSFDADRDIGKWLRGIARNLVRNELRKQSRQKRLLHEGLSELLLKHSDAEVASEEHFCAHGPELRDCVERLAPKSRRLVAGRYEDGWNASDLADHLGMTSAAVRQALMRIRQQLKHCIELRIAEASQIDGRFTT